MPINELIAEMPVVTALMERAIQLNEAFGDGSLHCFFIAYEMSRPDGKGDAAQRSSLRSTDVRA